jgi:hypothetical protein
MQALSLGVRVYQGVEHFATAILRTLLYRIGNEMKGPSGIRFGSLALCLPTI